MIEPITDEFGSRLRFAREKWDLSQTALVARSSVDVTTIRQVEAGPIDPTPTDAEKLSDALHVYGQWLTDGEIPMVSIWEMSIYEQHKAQSGPGTEGLPGYVIIGPGPWFRDEDGEWAVDSRCPER